MMGIDRERYRFVGRDDSPLGDVYVWEGPRVDSRVMRQRCLVSWFWASQPESELDRLPRWRQDMTDDLNRYVEYLNRP